MQIVIKEFETKFISLIPSIKLLLVGLCEIRVIRGGLSCGMKERGLVHGWVYLPSFKVYCETKNKIVALTCYNKNTHTYTHTYIYYNDDHQFFN